MGLKRGRPKGAEKTVITLQKVRGAKKAGCITPFVKLTPLEKDRFILESVVSKPIVDKSFGGVLINSDEVCSYIHLVPDLVMDSNTVNIDRVERYSSRPRELMCWV